MRHLGFSAHTEEAAVTAMDRFDFDSVLFPFNSVCMENGNFGRAVLAKAKRKKVARLAIKGLAWTPNAKGEKKPYPNCWYRPVADPDTARLNLNYTLGLPIVAAVSPAAASLFMLAVQIGLRYRPLTKGERARLMERIQGVEPIFSTPA